MARKIEKMYRIFGKCDGHTCRECGNLVTVPCGNRTKHKCRVYGVTHTEVSDWSGRHIGCGMLNKHWDGDPVLLLPTGRPKPSAAEPPLEGQMRFDV